MKEKKYNIILFLLLFVTILSTILIRPVQDMDEIWNYNFARNIANGLLPYKDFNIIVTPLLSIICGVILKITFNELIVMRFLAAILGASVLYLIYKIFNILNIKKEIATLYTFLIFALLRNYFFIDYNFAVILIGLIIIFWELKLYKKDDIFYKVNKNYEILLGILGGISITLKQTSGLLICIALLANKIIFIRRKEEFKIYLKSFCYRLIGILIPTTAFIIYLLYNGIFNDFINYTILGILEFTNKVPYTKLIKFNLVGILRIIVPITMIYSWIKTIILEKDKNEYFLLIYGIATFASICFPISNSIHFTISSLPIFIIILYELYKIILILYKKKKKYGVLFLKD